MPVTFTYDFGINRQISVVRMLVGDTDPAHPIFGDDEVLAGYSLNAFAVITPSGGGQYSSSAPASPFFVAATLLESLASNKARLASVGQLLDVHLDAAKASQELRATAKALRDSERNSGAFAIAEQVPTQFAARERLWKQMLRLQS